MKKNQFTEEMFVNADLSVPAPTADGRTLEQWFEDNFKNEDIKSVFERFATLDRSYNVEINIRAINKYAKSLTDRPMRDRAKFAHQLLAALEMLAQRLYIY